MADNNNEGEKYVCGLDEASIKKAKDELNEDPRERMSAVNTLRQWVISQTHMTFPVDTLTMLSFLRARKFSQLEARDQLDKFISIKTKLKDWFDDIDPMDPGIQAVIKSGLFYTLPKRDDQGRLIVVVSFGKLHPWKADCGYTKRDIFRTFVCFTFYIFFSDELTMVNGVFIIDDVTGLTMKHQTMFSIDEHKSFFGGWHKCVPARIKRMCLYNLGTFGDFVFMIIKLITPEKLQQRIVNCGSVIENVYKEVPMHLLPSDYLPDDYTGENAGTIQKIIDAMVKNISKPEVCARIRYLSSREFHVDESKRPVAMHPSESFRKLSVD